MLTAVTREVSSRLPDCELTHLDREPIDVDRAREQHAVYRRCLDALDLKVVHLPPLDVAPDAVFVEDPLVVTDEVAIAMRPASEFRREEVESLVEAVAPYRRQLRRIEDPGVLEGGDVLLVGRQVYVGISGRSNPSGVEQLGSHLLPDGYELQPLRVKEALHLKSALCALDEQTFLVNPDRVDLAPIQDKRFIEIHPEEPSAANALSLSGKIVMSDAFPATRQILERHGYTVLALANSEFRKAEGALTCCSVIFEDHPDEL